MIFPLEMMNRNSLVHISQKSKIFRWRPFKKKVSMYISTWNGWQTSRDLKVFAGEEATDIVFSSTHEAVT